MIKDIKEYLYVFFYLFYYMYLYTFALIYILICIKTFTNEKQKKTTHRTTGPKTG